MNIGICIYDRAEVLDFSGPFEVFSTASRVYPAEALFHAFLIGETGETVDARGGYRVIPDLRKSYPGLTVHESRRWVDEGPIVTSGGISAGIDMSLHIVSRLHSVELAEKTARQMEFDWKKEPE